MKELCLGLTSLVMIKHSEETNLGKRISFHSQFQDVLHSFELPPPVPSAFFQDFCMLLLWHELLELGNQIVSSICLRIVICKIV